MKGLLREITGGTEPRRPPRKLSEEEIETIRRLAEKGNAAAQVMLAATYVDKNNKQALSEAIKWLRQAATQGHADAEFNLGEAYFFGFVVEKDNSMAATWVERAAAQGHAEAQFRLGRMYSHGLGVTKNGRIAQEWFNRAAALGHTEARFWASIGLAKKESRNI
jgi:TPR repeat protein